MTLFLLCWYRSGCFKAYLFKTGRNLALRFGAKRGRLQTFAIEELTEEPSSPEETEAQFLDQERRLALHRCLNRIEPQYREALWLVYMEGLSYREASEVLRVSEKKIDRLLQQGKLVLQLFFHPVLSIVGHSYVDHFTLNFALYTLFLLSLDCFLTGFV